MTITRHMNTDELPHLLTMVELATYLPVPRSSLYALVRDGRLDGVHVGRRIMVKRESLQRLLKGKGLTSLLPSTEEVGA